MRNFVIQLGLGLTCLAGLAAYSMACTTSETDDKNNASSSGGTSSGTDGGSSSGNTADGGDGGGSSSGSTLPPATAIHFVTGVDSNDRPTGLYCAPGSTTCVAAITQMGSGDTKAHISTFDTTKVADTPILQTTDAMSDSIGLIGDIEFLGFQKIGTNLVLNLDTGSKGFVYNDGDPTVGTSWHVIKHGNGTPNDFGLNHQYGFGFDGTEWYQIRDKQGSYTMQGALPAAAIGWTNIWSTGGSGTQIPADIAAKKAADASWCSGDIAYSVSPTNTQVAYVAPDISIVMYGSGPVNQQQQPDGPGVCISLDKGTTFHIAKLPGQTEENSGPTALNCFSKDVCWAGGGRVSVDGSAYVYYTTNASAGKDSIWTKATIPATTGDTLINGFFFSDASHVWAFGTFGDSPTALLLASTDGGKTFTDMSGSLVPGSGSDKGPLWSGFAADATHFVVGGRFGQLYSTF